GQDYSILKLEQGAPSSAGVSARCGLITDLIDRVAAWGKLGDEPLEIADRVCIGQPIALGIDQTIADRHRQILGEVRVDGLIATCDENRAFRLNQSRCG